MTDSSVAPKDATAAWLTMAGAVLLGIGSILPVAAFSGLLSISRNAFQLGPRLTLSWDGPVVALLGIVALVIGISVVMGTTPWPRFTLRIPVFVGALAVVEAGILYNSANDMIRAAGSAVEAGSVGAGVWVIGAGGVLIVAGGIRLWRP